MAFGAFSGEPRFFALSSSVALTARSARRFKFLQRGSCFSSRSGESSGSIPGVHYGLR